MGEILDRMCMAFREQGVSMQAASEAWQAGAIHREHEEE